MLISHLWAFEGPMFTVLDHFCSWFPTGTFFGEPLNIRALLALLAVSLLCGAVGSIVVGNRMAFFSDALAHCAFAGVSFGFLLFKIFVNPEGDRNKDDNFWEWVAPVMVTFGAVVGAAIAFVREKTGLASDTVIGVFFAASLGFAAALSKLIKSRRVNALEYFLFGNPLLVTEREIWALFGLLIFTTLALVFLYNGLVLTSFNPSLARSRRLGARWRNYAFIILLALIVNLSLRYVGVLLINALLVVPAAAAFNLGRNLRQVFWITMIVSLVSAIGGQWISWELETRAAIELGVSGTIVLLTVAIFSLSAILGPFRTQTKA
ncbi:MAG: metal ABC transporter permease [Planctomycetota bacterium]|nr:metal ABC transporter permease [Planctomycetota bacterium]